MGKRKAGGNQHHDGNQTSDDDFHVKKYKQFPPQPTAIGLLGYSVTLPFARCADRGRVFLAQKSPERLFNLRENGFHLVPAKGAQGLTFDVAE